MCLLAVWTPQARAPIGGPRMQGGLPAAASRFAGLSIATRAAPSAPPFVHLIRRGRARHVDPKRPAPCWRAWQKSFSSGRCPWRPPRLGPWPTAHPTEGAPRSRPPCSASFEACLADTRAMDHARLLGLEPDSLDHPWTASTASFTSTRHRADLGVRLSGSRLSRDSCPKATANRHMPRLRARRRFKLSISAAWLVSI